MGGGGLPYANPVSTNPGVLSNAVLAAAGGCWLIGFTVYSSNAGSQFVQVFDANAIPADGLVPLYSLLVAATNFVSVYYGTEGRWFGAGIVVCNSSTATTKTIGAKDCLIDVQWTPYCDADSQ